MITCPTCAFENPDGALQCKRCERPLEDIRAKTLQPKDTNLSDPERIPLSGAILSNTTLGSSLKLSDRANAKAKRNTVVEGLPAVQLHELNLNPNPKTPPRKTEVLGAVPSKTEILSAVIPPKTPLADTLQGTLITSALPSEDQPPNEPQTQEHHPKDPLTTTAPQIPIQRTPHTPQSPPPNPSLFLIGLLVGIFATGLIGLAAYSLNSNHNNTPTHADNTSTNLPETVDVPSGPYLRGLSNDYRLIFSDLCKKVAKDPNTECKEEIALKGEYPQTSNDVDTFRIHTAEVTNAQWQECQNAKQCPKINTSLCTNLTTRGLQPFQSVPSSLFAPEKPVVCINLAEAKAFCSFAQGSLPTADQWEKAARGTDAYLFPWGTNWDPKLANWAERDILRTNIPGQLDKAAETAPPGSFPNGTSPYGAHDMGGNVSEWVLPEDDSSLEAFARGGSWLSDPLQLRTTYRIALKANTRRTDVGFRCAFPPSQSPAPNTP